MAWTLRHTLSARHTLSCQFYVMAWTLRHTLSVRHTLSYQFNVMAWTLRHTLSVRHTLSCQFTSWPGRRGAKVTSTTFPIPPFFFPNLMLIFRFPRRVLDRVATLRQMRITRDILPDLLRVGEEEHSLRQRNEKHENNSMSARQLHFVSGFQLFLMR